MKWIKFSERWPAISTELLEPYEVIVRSPEYKDERKAVFMFNAMEWRLSDCTHPMQNCYLNTSTAEWLED